MRRWKQNRARLQRGKWGRAGVGARASGGAFPGPAPAKLSVPGIEFSRPRPIVRGKIQCHPKLNRPLPRGRRAGGRSFPPPRLY